MSDETATPPRIKIAWLAGTLAAFALFAAIAAYSARMTWDYTDYDQDRAAQRYDTLKKLRHDEQILISPVDAQGHPTAEWIDQDKGVVRIPIEEAMAKEVDALKNQPAQAGSEIPPAVPPAPAKSATPTASAAPVAGAPALTNAAPAKSSAPPARKSAAKPAAAQPAAAPAKPDKSNP